MLPRSAIDSSRRSLITSLCAGVALTALGGCAGARPAQPREFQRPYSRQTWAAPRISMDGVIRVVAGLRPYRPAGFVVRSEAVDGKTLVHNYGHGGGGLSLSWGTSALAVREVRHLPPGEAAVVGSGIMGLTSARLLQDAGWKVTIHTRDPWRHTTSNLAAGAWEPFSVFDPEAIGPDFMPQFLWAARVAHHAFTNLSGAGYGIRWLETYTLREEPFPEGEEPGPLADLFAYRRTFGPGEHPFSLPYARHALTMQIDPAVLLARLAQDFLLAGGTFLFQAFATADEILALPQSVIFNCTGLGSRELFGDTGLTAAKGQLVFLPPDPAVDYLLFGGGRGILYMFPRSDVLLLGGTFEVDDFSLHPNPDETERIVSAHRRIFELGSDPILSRL